METMASVPPRAPSDDVSGKEAESAARGHASSLRDPMQEFSRRLDDIIDSHAAAAASADKPNLSAPETEAKVNAAVSKETDITLIMQSLNKSSSPEEKLGDLVKKYAELSTLRRCEERKVCVLQQKLSSFQEEKLQLQQERSSRRKLEALCRDMMSHYTVLTEEALRRCREDEQKRDDITGHFQSSLAEIQSQIEQQSERNLRLCEENHTLSQQLENMMGQCERRDQSQEKLDRHHELQHKLTEAKLQESNLLLSQAEEKHKREKEYLLREAIDKTKKCFSMKEAELGMKKKLTLYAQKFDEFQATLAKSNEIYVRFRKEMDNMSDKMKEMEKESNLWKSRFENCNKALTDMIQERADKGKEYELFVLKIHKLENLCRALQEERAVLYQKIKEIRQSNSELPARVFGTAVDQELQDQDQDQELQDQDPALTRDMARLREQQAKLQEIAASLLDTPTDRDRDQDRDRQPQDLDQDLAAAAFDAFRPQSQRPEPAAPRARPPQEPEPQPVKEAEPEPVKEAEPVKEQEPVKEAEPEQVKEPVQEAEVSAAPPSEVVDVKLQQNQEPVRPEPEPEPPTAETSSQNQNQNQAAAAAAEAVNKAAPKKKKKKRGGNS